jgi:hypothetical protein
MRNKVTNKASQLTRPPQARQRVERSAADRSGPSKLVSVGLRDQAAPRHAQVLRLRGEQCRAQAEDLPRQARARGSVADTWAVLREVNYAGRR